MNQISGQVVTSILASVAFLAALIVAYLADDKTDLTLIIGAIIANFTTTVTYWLGSSASSQKKDEIIASKS